jgi:serine/threonine protein kinase
MLLVLEHLHSMFIIYRDLRPEVIQIDQDGYLKFTEFGNSAVLDGDRAYEFVGVP